MKQQKEGIRYVQYPLEVVFHPEVTPTDALVYWYISLCDSTDKHCWASNEDIAAKLQIAEYSVTRSVMKLIRLGFIIKVHFDGRTRTIKTNDDLTSFRKYRVEFNLRGRKEKSVNCGGRTHGAVGAEPTSQTRITDNNECIRIKDKEVMHDRDRATPLLKKSLAGEKGITLAKPHKEILEYYYNAIGKKMPPATSKSLKDDRDALRDLRKGVLFDGWSMFQEFNHKFTNPEIKAVIDLHVLASNPEYETYKKQHLKIYFHRFLLSNHPKTSVKSYFCKWLKDPPKHKGFIKPNSHPEITAVWEKKLTNGKGLPPDEMNKLILGAERLIGFVDAYPKKLRSIYKTDEAKARFHWDAAEKDDSFNGPVVAGNLCSDYMFNIRLPYYCEEKAAIFEEEDDYSPLYS